MSKFVEDGLLIVMPEVGSNTRQTCGYLWSVRVGQAAGRKITNVKEELMLVRKEL